MDNTVLFFGAGFSRASGLPDTDSIANTFAELEPTNATPAEIQYFISRRLTEFWMGVFGWHPGRKTPSLEDHFTLLDLAANTGHNLGHYTPRQLRAIRRFSIHRIFDILDQPLAESPEACELMQAARTGHGNTVITTNWDVAAERFLGNRADLWYGFQAQYVDGGPVPRSELALLKLHGSSNWMYCDSCRRIYIKTIVGCKEALHGWTYLHKDDFRQFPPDQIDLDRLGERQRHHCNHCGLDLSARVATFSYRKALGFFQFQSVWDKALESMRECRTWVFIGYSLPQADFEIRALIKTAQMADQADGRRRIVAVVGHNRRSACNYRRFFGDAVKIHERNLDEWWQTQNVV